MIDLYTTEYQYADHLLPVWDALPPDQRGTAYLPKQMQGTVERLRQRGDEARYGPLPRGGTPVMVASWQDEWRVQRVRGRTPIVYLEHGAGQTYGNTHVSYSGGDRHDAVRLFLCPNETVAMRWRNRYPQTSAVAVGCPKLDAWDSVFSLGLRAQQPKTVAISFHPDYREVAPEATGAWRYYDEILPKLAQRFRLLGHGHPRLYPHLVHRWRQLDIPHTRHFSHVLDQASLFIADNSSTAYEFAATGRPVILLNAPWYRRDIEHGLRFWSLIPGPTCDTPDDLPDLIQQELDLPQRHATLRETVSQAVYAYRDGSSARRAVEAILEVAGGE